MLVDVGGKIKRMRQCNGISQNLLAKKAGIAQSTLSYIESGIKHPKFETLSCICYGLGTSVFDLLSYNENDGSTKLNEQQILAASLLKIDGILICDQLQIQRTLYETYLSNIGN